MERLIFSYEEPPQDVLIIEGIPYSGELFRAMAGKSAGLGLQLDTPFKITKRPADGLIVIERIGE